MFEGVEAASQEPKGPMHNVKNMNNAMSCGCRAGSCNGILAGFGAQRPREIDEKIPLAERKPRPILKINLN